MQFKTTALVMNRFRYGESSLIIRLFTRERGLVGVMYKGALKKKVIPEVGAFIEASLSRRGNEGLYTLIKPEITSYTRFESSLLKTAIRDTAFEVGLLIMQEEGPNPELYTLYEKFLIHLEDIHEEASLFGLWLFLMRKAEYLGFGYSAKVCSVCGLPLRAQADLVPGRDGFVCNRCLDKKSRAFSRDIISMLGTGYPQPGRVLPALSNREKKDITSRFTNYLRHHFGLKQDIQSLSFLYDVM